LRHDTTVDRRGRVEQDALLPPNAADVLPADHLAWAAIALAEELDLSVSEAAYRDHACYARF
jgi:hypothetical protein